MDTPRSSLTGLIAIVFLGLPAVCGYNASGQTPATGEQPPPAPVRAIGLSQVIEPYYQQLFSELKISYAADLVPALTLARERLVGKQTGTPEKDKKAVYEHGVKLLDAMKIVAQERTQLLASLLKESARPGSSLEPSKSMTASNDHFLNLHLQRSNEALKRKKPALDNLFAQLRTAEREWNARLPEGTRSETYNFKNLPHAIIRPTP